MMEMDAAMFSFSDEEFLAHYGMPRRSGRYPWGSGENPYQHSEDFLSRVEKMQAEGKSLSDIADELDIVNATGKPSVTRLKDQMLIAKNQRRILEVKRAESLRADGKSLDEIAKIMGYSSDSSIRSLLNPESKARMAVLTDVADALQKQCDEKGMIDVGTGTEKYLNISHEKLRQSLELLKAKGYEVYGGGLPQATNPGQQTNLLVLCPPGTKHSEIYNYKDINFIDDIMYHESTGKMGKAFEYPASLDSKRLMINYAEDGGIDKDGVIELRRGVPDLSLGESRYAQVRILVDGTHYLKGMAVYADDLPDGVDVRFNTNKTKDKSKLEVLKPISDDPDNPFGALLKEHGGQYRYEDPRTGEQKLGLINKTREEGDWSDWADKLPAQFLSKQNMKLVNQQLGKSIDDKKAEYDSILALTNPVVKKHFLMEFSRDCDSTATHLNAAALPRQKYHVLLPLGDIKDTEAYLPDYENGEKVALIRYPHGGIFEIPILTVNNKSKTARSIIGTDTNDVIGISKSVADRLSGADFDGDTVMVIPVTERVNISTKPPLKGLEGFEPKIAYAEHEGMTYMKYTDKNGKKVDNTQKQMGMISNLITDMTIQGATDDELAAAVRHSMVVIDAGKHKLDYKKSEIDNNIAALKQKYQVKENGKSGGAATIISRAKSETSIPRRQGSARIDPETGKLVYKTMDEDKLYYPDRKTGEMKARQQKVALMEVTDDAMELVSPARAPVEIAYANYANSLKAMANAARKEYVATKGIQYSSEAASEYKDEVNKLLSDLNTSLKNAPRERRAQILARTTIDEKKASNPNLKDNKKELKKISQLALNEGRNSSGAERNIINISDRQWEAIQKGAISSSMLEQIMNFADKDRLRELATPKSANELSSSQIARIKRLQNNGYTTNEIARSVGVSSTTVAKYLK